jgi:hypothetical protein
MDQITKRNVIAASVVVSLILIASAAVVSFIDALTDDLERPPFQIVSSSPQQTYVVTVERKKREYTKEDWTSWKLYLSFVSQGRQVLNEAEVDAGDSSGGPNWAESPQLNWVYENTFRLDDTASLPESESDVLFVRNDSARELSYLSVSGENNELFYILNLAPQASIKLYARPQWKRADISGISASGQFINGEKIYGYQGFKLPYSAKGPGRYCLSVKGNTITIVSRDFEGFELADFTPEEKRQIEEYRLKRKAGQLTQADEKTIQAIYGKNRPEVITPKSPDCGDFNAASSRP